MPNTTAWATESAVAAPERVTETATFEASKPGRFEVTIVTPGVGSSGVYTPEVLARAAEEGVFKAGTHLHLDHASEPGARSVTTLAAVLTEDARWDPDWVDPETGNLGRLVAEARPIGANGDTVREMADVIGVSISAAAEFGVGQDDDGRPVRAVERLIPHPLNTVDFVSVPGRGGRFSVLEAAKAQEAATVATYLEARVHSFMQAMFADMYGDGRLTKDEWTVMQHAAGEAVIALTNGIASLPSLGTRGPWADAPTNSPAAEAEGTPGHPATESTSDTSQEDHMPQIEQAELDKLREDAGRAATLAAENAQLREEKEAAAKEAAEQRVTAAEQVIREAYGDDAPAFIVEAARTAAAADKFDAQAAREAATAVHAKQAGTPTGLGQAAESATRPAPTPEAIVAALHGKEA